MSTILKSLRKLEEEKKRIDKKLNLKEMMIREDARPPVSQGVMGKPRHWWAGLGLLLAGLAVAGITAILLWPDCNQSTEKNSRQAASNDNKAPRTTENDVPKTLGGVPLSSIPDFTQRAPREDEGAIEEYFIEEEPLALESPAVGEEPAVIEPVKTPAVIVETKPEPVIDHAPGANDQIINALDQVPTQTRTTLKPSPTLPVIISTESGETIEGLKLKGIIFYGEGSAENYLLFSYPGMSIHRLKVGESIAEAKLLEIHPGLAVFEYQGKHVKLKVGS